MLDNILGRVHVRIKFIILPVFIPATVEDVEHPLGNALLAVGRPTQKVDHTTGQRTKDRLVIFQKLGVRFTHKLTLDGHVVRQDEWRFLIRERVPFHADHCVAHPCGDDGHEFIVPFDVVPAPVFIGHDPLPQRVLEVEGGRGLALVVIGRQYAGIFPINIFEIFVPIRLFHQFGLRGLEGHNDEHGLVQIAPA